MKFKVSELDGDLLDYAVIVATKSLKPSEIFRSTEGEYKGKLRFQAGPQHFATLPRWSFNTDYAGDLIITHALDVKRIASADVVWMCKGLIDPKLGDVSGSKCVVFGDTLMVTICRCVVTMRLGPTIDIPKDLLP